MIYSYFYTCFQGILLFQVIFIMAQALMVRRKEYVYYLIYMVMLILYNHAMLKPGTFTNAGILFSPDLQPFFDKPAIVLSIYMYYHFARQFLEIPQRFKRFNRQIKRIQWILITYVFVEIILLLLWGKQDYNEWIFLGISTFNIFASVWSVTSFMLKQKTPLNYFILTGAVLVTVGAVSSMVFIILDPNWLFPPVFIFQVFIILEIIVFTTGLAYKSKLIETEKLGSEKKLVEELREKEYLQKSMQQLRNKIAGDLHDDLGSTLGSIAVYTEAGKKSIEANHPERASEALNRIYHLSVDSLKNLREMVWVITPGNEKWEHLRNRMENFGKDVLNARNISFKMEDTIPEQLLLSVIQRRNLYLVFKECIHNILKHSEARNVCLRTKVSQSGRLIFIVEDDGKGRTEDIKMQGHGLKNLAIRARELNGSFIMKNSPLSGISIHIEFSLTNINPQL